MTPDADLETLFRTHSSRLVKDLKTALAAVQRPDVEVVIDAEEPVVLLRCADLSIYLEAGELQDIKLDAPKPQPGPVPAIWWVLYRTVIIPGVRYYADGSGQPDDADVVELLRVNLAGTRQIATAAVLAHLEAAIDAQFEVDDEDNLARDLIESEKLAQEYFASQDSRMT